MQKWFRSQTGGRHPLFVRDGPSISVLTVGLDQPQDDFAKEDSGFEGTVRSHPVVVQQLRDRYHPLLIFSEGGVEYDELVAEQYPAGWTAAAENISWQSGFDTLTSAVQWSFDGLVNSPGYYRNMVNPRFTHLAVGIAVDEDGAFWLTQNFAHYTSAIVEATNPRDAALHSNAYSQLLAKNEWRS